MMVGFLGFGYVDATKEFLHTVYCYDERGYGVSGSLLGIREQIVIFSNEGRLKLLNHNLGFLLGGIGKLSHLLQGRHTNTVLTFY